LSGGCGWDQRDGEDEKGDGEGRTVHSWVIQGNPSAHLSMRPKGHPGPAEDVRLRVRAPRDWLGGRLTAAIGTITE
jgi:hypothetical protein